MSHRVKGGPVTGPPPARRNGELKVQMTGIRKSFYENEVLKDVDLDIRGGELHALVGENGSGKSTLIKALAGFHPIDAGVISMGGEDLNQVAPGDCQRHGIRFVHQNGNLVHQLTVIENIMLLGGVRPTRWGTINRGAERRAVEKALAVLDISLDLDRPVGELRAVERTAVSLAAALSSGEVNVLVLDEPTAALPYAEVEMLFTLLQQFVEQGAAVVYVTHRLDEVLNYADRATVLRDGELVSSTPVCELDEATLASLIVGPAFQLDRAEPQVSQAGETSRGGASSSGGPLRVRELRTELLDGISFTVQPGEIVGIAGLSGSGREQVASALVGVRGSFAEMVLPSGDIVEELNPIRARKLGVALVPGNRLPGSAIFPFTVQENIGITSLDQHTRRFLLDTTQENQLVKEWIERLDVRPPRPHKPFRELSGGNQQKVILAKWLSINPQVVIMDEPTSGVDVGARRAIYDVAKAFAALGTAFVFCSSDAQDIVEMADRALLIAKGQIVEEVPSSRISSEYIIERLMIGHREATESESA